MQPFPRPSMRQLVTTTLLSAVILSAVLHIVTDLDFRHFWWAILAVIVIGIFQTLLQSVYGRLIQYWGIFATMLVAFTGYGLALWLALRVMPSDATISLGQSILVAWLYAAIVSVVQWIMAISSGSYLLQLSIRAARRYNVTKQSTPGFLFVQLDGVPYELLQLQITAGNLPNIQQLIESEDYTLTPWQTQLPSTTPASQAGILFGNNRGIPAFRWYERETGSMVVANQARGAALIESRVSNGDGLLAHDGVGIGNLFSGDAEEAIMVISKMNTANRSLEAMHRYTDYFASPSGFMRSLVLSVGEMIKELYQAYRQKSRHVRPRVHRFGSYVFLRAGTNVLLRDLQTRIILDMMLRGKSAIYADFLDYDEIAHHAGIARPEALAALAGLDAVVGTFMTMRPYAPRPYHIVLLSDHGQSQGATFKQLHDGVTLPDFVARLTHGQAVSDVTHATESDSTAQLLKSSLQTNTRMGRHFAKRADEREAHDAEQVDHSAADAEIVFTGSGNLGNIWLPHAYAKRPTRQQLDRDFPDLLPGLLDLEGVGLVIVRTGRTGFVCLGKNGSIRLDTAAVSGENPLVGYDWIDIKALLKLATIDHAPDIQVISSIDATSHATHAFEELVGNHGGIGGMQTHAFVLHPNSLHVPSESIPVRDSTELHTVLKTWIADAQSL